MQPRLSDLAAVAVAVVALVAWGDGVGKPRALAIPAPSVEARSAVAPITTVLAAHADQARELAAFYHAAADAVRRDGAGAKVLANTSHLRTFCERAVTLRFQGAFQKVPGLSEAIHGPSGALAKLLKLEAAELDHGKAAEAFEAIAWACQEAGR